MLSEALAGQELNLLIDMSNSLNQTINLSTYNAAPYLIHNDNSSSPR